MIRFPLIACVALLVLARIAAAEPNVEPDSQSASVPVLTHDTLSASQPAAAPRLNGAPAWRKPKNLGHAYAYSFLGTLIPVAMALGISAHSQSGNQGDLIGSLAWGGIIAGPALGEFYAGSYVGGAVGMGIRGLGAIMFIQGFNKTFDNSACGALDADDKCKDDAAAPLLVFGSVFLLGGTVYSIAHTAFVVDRHNERYEYGLMPVLVPGGEGAMKTGAVAWMRF